VGVSGLWNYLEKGLVAGDSKIVELFPIKNLKINLISRNGTWNLEVSGNTDLWGGGVVPFEIVFFYTNSTLDFFVSFGIQLSALPTSLVPKDTSTNPHVSEWYHGLSLSSLITVGIGSTTFTDLSGTTFKRGITISTKITANSNLPLYHELHQLMYSASETSNITGTLVAYFPLDSSDPLATFTLTLNGGINFGISAVKSSNLVLELVVSTNPNVKISTTVWVAIGNQTLQFTVFADLGLLTGFEFKGSLDSPWKAPFGLQWLTFTNVALDFKLSLGAIGTLTFNMDATLTFSGAPPVHTTFDFDLTPPEKPSILFTIETSIAGVDILFDKLIGVRPPNVDQITVQGSTTLAIATAPKQGYQTGLSIKGNAILAGKGPLADAGRAISSYSQKPLQFTFFLYVPIFSSAPEDINFQLSEITPIQIGDGAIMDTVTFQFVLNPKPVVTLSSKLTITIENSPTNFDLTAVIQQGSLSFTGKQEGDWDHAFGFVWLKISDATLQLTYNTTTDQITQLSLTGGVNITFGTPKFPTISVYFTQGFKQWAYSIACNIPNLGQFSNQVMKRNDAPSTSNEIGVDASLTVSNFAHDNVIAGVTLVGSCTISGNGKIAAVFHGLKGNFVQTFSADLAIPIWDSNMPTLQIGYSEQGGKITLTPNIILNGLGFVVRLVPNPSVSVTSQGIITISKNAALTFNVEAAIGGTQGFEINGQLQGTWTKPFGMPWLALTNVGLTIGLNSGFQVNQLSFSANPTFTFQKQSITLQGSIMTSSNFQDFAFSCLNIPVNSVVDVVQHTFGSVPPEVQSLNAVQGTIDLVLATYSGTTSQGLAFSNGLTLMQQVQLSNSLLGKLAVFHAGSLQLWSSISIPIWGGTNIAIGLATNQVVTFSSEASMSGISFDVQTSPPSIDAHATVKLNLKSNDPLTFTLAGSVSVTGGVTLTGAMQGVWNNVFGVHGFDVSNAVVKIGLAPQFCPLCFSDLGIGFTMPMGQTAVIFYANIDLTNLWDEFVDAQLPAISFQQIGNGYNHMVGNSLPHINTATIPANWGFTAVKFYLAPTAGTFGGITYQAGFFLQGGIILFGIEASSNIQVTPNDFVFKVSLDKASIQNSINGKLLFLIENDDVFKQSLNLTENQLLEILLDPMAAVEVTLVDLQGMSLQSIASGKMPSFVIQYKFLGKNGHASFGVLLSDLWGDFSSFFNKNLKKLFKIL